MRTFIPTLAAAVILAILIGADVTKPMGAHPWWSQKTLLFGAPIGLILATLLARVSVPVTRLAVAVVLTTLAFGVAKYGQTQFAASYAEDALAGKLWYFGWIAVGATAASLLTFLMQMILPGTAGRTPSGSGSKIS